jgi:hypothetical protein
VHNKSFRNILTKHNLTNLTRIVDKFVGDVRVFWSVFVNSCNVEQIGADSNIFRDVEGIETSKSRRVIIDVFNSE